MKLSQHLHTKQTQTLSMTASLQQAIKLLQMTQLELNLEVEAQLNSNIMLEPDFGDDEEDESNALKNAPEENRHEHTESYDKDSSVEELSFDQQEYDAKTELDWTDFDDNEVKLQRNDEQDGDLFERLEAQSESLNEALKWQLNLAPFSQSDRRIAELLIDSIDHEGYLRITLSDALDALLPILPDLELDEIEAVLKRIQAFDPCGVGARTLEECLLLQIKELNPRPEWADLAQQILSHYSDLLARLDLVKLRRKLKVDEELLRIALNGLKRLDPKPGLSYGIREGDVLHPDVFVRIEGPQLTVSLNQETIPKIRINKEYSKIAQFSKKDGSVLRHHLNDARFFLKSIETRFDTLLKVAREIVHFQHDFFFDGAQAMRPLQLKHIADKLDIHESTVSRAVSGKYLMCPTGTYELKFFFSNQMSPHLHDSSDEDPSGVAIRAVLKQILDEENSEKPFSDSKLSLLLEERGFNVARRTVAKYREMLGVLSSNERKRLH